MLRNYISFILIATFAHAVFGQYASDLELQEAFKFSNKISTTMEGYINNALPPAAKSEGAKILQNVENGLRYCESDAQTTRNTEKYKTCSSSLFDEGMALLGALQGKYRPYTSGASRMTLFWL